MRAAVIILRQSQVLLIHRLKYGQEYYVLPGGTVEPEETIENAARREALEETSLTVELDRFLTVLNDKSTGQEHHLFLVTHYTGEPQLGNGPEAATIGPDNQYLLEWHDLDKLSNLLIYPVLLKPLLISALPPHLYRVKSKE